MKRERENGFTSSFFFCRLDTDFVVEALPSSIGNEARDKHAHLMRVFLFACSVFGLLGPSGLWISSILGF